MLITGVLCLLAAVASLGFGVRTLSRPLTADPEQRVMRAVAPAQVAAGVILGAGGAAALAGPPAIGLLAVFIAVTGALTTLGVGAWLGARYAARQYELISAGSGGGGCSCDGCGCGDSAAPEADVQPGPVDMSIPGLMPGSLPETPVKIEAFGCGDGCGCSDSPAVPAEALGCGDGCGCSQSAPVAAEPSGGCGSGCGCG